MQRFADLKVWQRSHSLALHVYGVTADYPAEERFGLTSQLRRAAVSVAANIAEGAKRRTQADYARFLNMAEGSLAEVEYLVILSRDLHLLLSDSAQWMLSEVEEIARMLNGLRTTVEKRARTASSHPVNCQL